MKSSQSWSPSLEEKHLEEDGQKSQLHRAAVSSEELPTPSQRDSPHYRGSRSTPVPQLQKISQKKQTAQSTPFHPPSRNQRQLELMSRALPGIQVVSQIACPVQAKKKGRNLTFVELCLSQLLLQILHVMGRSLKYIQIQQTEMGG